MSSNRESLAVIVLFLMVFFVCVGMAYYERPGTDATRLESRKLDLIEGGQLTAENIQADRS